jgi:hypothetical protein
MPFTWLCFVIRGDYQANSWLMYTCIVIGVENIQVVGRLYNKTADHYDVMV